jgi:hypothetical protein
MSLPIALLGSSLSWKKEKGFLLKKKYGFLVCA